MDIREFTVVRRPICVAQVEQIAGGVLLLMTSSICITGKGPMNATCGKAFVRRSYLIPHHRIHRGETPVNAVSVQGPSTGNLILFDIRKSILEKML